MKHWVDRYRCRGNLVGCPDHFADEAARDLHQADCPFYAEAMRLLREGHGSELALAQRQRTTFAKPIAKKLQLEEGDMPLTDDDVARITQANAATLQPLVDALKSLTQAQPASQPSQPAPQIAHHDAHAWQDCPECSKVMEAEKQAAIAEFMRTTRVRMPDGTLGHLQTEAA